VESYFQFLLSYSGMCQNQAKVQKTKIDAVDCLNCRENVLKFDVSPLNIGYFAISTINPEKISDINS